MIETIKQFFLSIWTWFVENKDGIIAFFVSGQALSFVGALVLLIKNLSRTKSNTESTEKLNATLTNTNVMSESVKAIDENFTLLKNENMNLRNELEETKTKLEKSNHDISNKLDVILDVQTIVYSTIRDDEVRSTVNKLLNNARYSGENVRESFEKKIDELKANYEKGFNEVNAKMAESIDTIKGELNNVKNAETKASNRLRNVRY